MNDTPLADAAPEVVELCPDCKHDVAYHVEHGCNTPQGEPDCPCRRGSIERCPDCGAPTNDRSFGRSCRLCGWPTRRQHDFSKPSNRSRAQIAAHVAAVLEQSPCYRVPIVNAAMRETPRLQLGRAKPDSREAQLGILAREIEATLGSHVYDLREELTLRREVAKGKEEPPRELRHRLDTPASRNEWKAQAEGALAQARTLQARARAVLDRASPTCDEPGPDGLTCTEKAGHGEPVWPDGDLDTVRGPVHSAYKRDPTSNERFGGRDVTWTRGYRPVAGCCAKHRTGGKRECIAWAVHNGRWIMHRNADGELVATPAPASESRRDETPSLEAP